MICFVIYILLLNIGLLSALVTHPFDVVKTRQQLGIGVGGIQDIYRREGFRALWSGLSMRLSTVIPSGAIVVSVYEYLKALQLCQSCDQQVRI